MLDNNDLDRWLSKPSTAIATLAALAALAWALVQSMLER